MLSVVLTVLSARYWVVPPADRFQNPSAAHPIGILAFLFASGVIVALGEGSRRKNERLERAQAESEERVRQRTAELDAANHSLRELTARLLQLQDDERRRIARELHDSVGQTLAVLAMNLSAVGTDIERLMKTAGAIADSRGLVDEMSENIRTISYLLHPPLLDEKGLSSALRWYIEGFAERSRIEVDLELPGDVGRLSRDLETAIFRVVQECLTNIHRHSGSASAKIRIRCSARDISVEVEDRGKGMPPEKRHELASAGTPGVGIRGMQERIRQLGGSLEIHSDGVGKGTLVVARLPLVAAAPSAASTT
jgi:two-component system NarL family sensor kinase